MKSIEKLQRKHMNRIESLKLIKVVAEWNFFSLNSNEICLI